MPLDPLIRALLFASAMSDAIHGKPQELATILRSGHPLDQIERNRIADFIEGKLKRGPGRPPLPKHPRTEEEKRATGTRDAARATADQVRAIKEEIRAEWTIYGRSARHRASGYRDKLPDLVDWVMERRAKNGLSTPARKETVLNELKRSHNSRNK